jgi:hypothetical protein
MREAQGSSSRHYQLCGVDSRHSDEKSEPPLPQEVSCKKTALSTEWRLFVRDEAPAKDSTPEDKI